ncbi:hypothetical protein [Rummeliibacillus pycnus]|uniref:hypothetical protein n=1 Tax=Rummeliibacillus pycnus TaxID=101070 RepID=UPI0014759E4F|nr:hypothetical protein [Rummeliibacillus pycnus]
MNLGYIKAKIDLKLNDTILDFSERYPYWKELWSNYTEHYSEVQIQNWKEEEQTIQELEQISFLSRNEGLVKIHQVLLSEETRDYFQNHASINEKLKWFSMVFHDEEMIEGMEIHNYGEEVYFNQVTKEEAEPILEMFEQLKCAVEFIPDDTD